MDDLILRYDVDFDVPLRHEYAIGILRMVDVFRPVPGDDPHAVARRVGAHWCDIVRSDMVYDHWAALRMIDASQGDAERLREAVSTSPVDDPFVPYATARWHDATGKIRYRLGSYSRARMTFETAIEVAERHRLWWCLPDLHSNVSRARYEESRQGARPDVSTLIEELGAERRRILDEAPAHGVAIGEIAPDAIPRHREYLRGYSSVLHNLAIALKDRAGRDHTGEDAAESLRVSAESIRVSYALGDHFRISQSLNHQALLDRDRAEPLFQELAKGRYPRGRLIARQHLAILKGNGEGARELQQLLDELVADSNAVGGIGTDIHVATFTVDEYARLVAGLRGRISADEHRSLAEDVARKRFTMAESVRRAVAMPAYKRAYAKAIRPSYLERIADRIGRPGAEQVTADRAEEAFGLVESSSARELLDMLSTAALPQLPLPPSSAAAAPRIVPAQATDETADEPDGPPVRGRRAVVRRNGVRRSGEDVEAALRPELARRETEFEEAFLHQPLEAAPQDPEIAHRVRMYTVNNPDTCVVRYFAYGSARPEFLGAFVFLAGEMRCVTGLPYDELRRLAERLPTATAPSRSECEEIWRLVLAPVWPLVTASGEPAHLVVIPTDDLFAVPIHVAWEPGAPMPLAARLPVSQSVSATAFVGRGRSLLKRQPVSADDDLAAIVVADDAAMAGGRGVSGSELLGTGWPAERMVIAGDRPAQLDRVERHFAADMHGISEIAGTRPEFFVYAGHGSYHPQFAELGPYLELRGNYLTQYDLALRLRLPRNKLTILGACLAGQGAQTTGGDVVGFLRSLIATGAGAVGVPLWSVQDGAMVRTVRELLAASRTAVIEGGVFDVVEVLHRRYRSLAERIHDPDLLVEHLPLSLYL
ncbi:CHAT domain-containing protein [Micromonospora mangrovi]|uniref:CHAT domain-containing protein n=2 Tax=Micromonospora TaxID=1873 RepID=A0AAU7M8S7_9ACTN